MDMGLAGKTAFVSGSTQGIGFAVASALAGEGVHVTLNGRSTGSVEDAVQRLQQAHPAVHTQGLVADFGDAADVGQLLDRLSEVDILVNNVGLFGLAEFATVDDADWNRYLQVNLMSGVRLSRRLLPVMLEKGSGRIVFISSESGVNVPADMIHYGVTKAAMIALSNGLAKLTGGSEVTVNTVLGGPTYSTGVAAAVEAIALEQSQPVETMKQAIAGRSQTSLLGRFIEPAEIASTVAFLASPRASAINGAAVRVDGGVLTSML